MNSNVRYLTADVPVRPWMIQGTIYEDRTAAKFGAAKLYTAYNVRAVIVKPTKDGKFALLYTHS